MITQAANAIAGSITPHQELSSDLKTLIADYISDWGEEELEEVRRIRGQKRWYENESFKPETDAMADLKNYMRRLEKSLLVLSELKERVDVGKIALENSEHGINVMFNLPSEPQPGSAFVIVDDDLEVSEDRLAEQIAGWIENDSESGFDNL
jgi:hypothetical protein